MWSNCNQQNVGTGIFDFDLVGTPGKRMRMTDPARPLPPHNIVLPLDSWNE